MEGANNIVVYHLTLTEIISLIIGVASIALGLFAIWLSLHIKRESETLNKETKDLLVEINTDAKSITRGVLSEMEKWGDLGRTVLTSSSEERRTVGEGIHSESKITTKDLLKE